MRTILTMAMKDLRLMSRDWLGMFFIICFPIAMGIFFGSIMGQTGGEKPILNVAIVDEDGSPTSETFISELKANNVEVENLDRTAALDKVRRGSTIGMIAIPKGFGDSAGLMWKKSPPIELGVDPSRKAESGMLQGNIMQAMGKLMMTRFQDPASMKPLIEQARQDISTSDDLPAVVRPPMLQMMDSFAALTKTWEAKQAEEKAAGTPPSKGPEFQFANIKMIDVTHTAAKGSREELFSRIRSQWDISFPQAMMWGVLACAAGFAITIVRERKQGTFLRLQVAPVTRSQVVAGKATACFLAVIAVIGIMCALGTWLGMRPRSPGLLVLASVSIASCFVGIMMLMSVVGKTEEAVSGAAWGGNMLMATFGGAMIPLLFMPSFMRVMSNVSPVKWSILALEGSIWRGFTPTEMLLPCGILVAIGVFCLSIGATVLSRATS